MIPHNTDMTGVKASSPGENVAILFARTPVPGGVKSRLQTHLTAEQACRLHIASTRDTAELLDRALPNASKWIFWSDSPPDTELLADSLPASFQTAVQSAGDLGARMEDAFTRARALGSSRVVIFGSDSPTLPGGIVRQSFAALEACDLVLGPTEDGGYYLIGCRRFDPELFRAVAWSTARTFEQTLANAERLGWRIQTLKKWFDIDGWKDVERLLLEGSRGAKRPRNLDAFLKQLQKEKGAVAP
jgi:uncharacterized protein